jgi:hypothetical protein
MKWIGAMNYGCRCYGNGGHGYGLRPGKDSEISTWPSHAAHWLGTQGLLD